MQLHIVTLPDVETRDVTDWAKFFTGFDSHALVCNYNPVTEMVLILEKYIIFI